VFEKVLIANRGEIACRVMRTLHRLGIRSVAVYSEADAGAAHVAMADEAHLLGPAPASESYLKIEAVLHAAHRSGAQAVHPGYGFLSENAEFAEACAKQGLVFIGPPPEAIRAMGSKSAAKALMEKAGVPLVPGYHGTKQEPKFLAAQAEKIGYPVLIKATAGGGGKGMRIVEKPGDFAEALTSAKREAAAFADDKVLIEAYLKRPRHIEVQVFADGHGNAVHLFERDCSIQRRYQKVIEEAPAPGMDPARRAEMGAAAVAAARACGYVGAGTVEFISEGKQFYFMEMNTRLQVEHPITEKITGQDLVEWQLRVAVGEALPLGQDNLEIHGHAIEARLYAEDPARDFLPAVGRLARLKFPAESAHVRVDSGVRQGDQISVHYDPMIAKVVAWDLDRPAALARLQAALSDTEIVGTTTNLAFLSAIARHPAYAKAKIDTGFIGRYRKDLVPAPGPATDEALAVACLAELLHRRAQAAAAAKASNDPYSPWSDTSGWRLNVDTHSRLAFLDGEQETVVTVYYRADGYELVLNDKRVSASGDLGPDGALQVEFDGRRFSSTVVRHEGDLIVLLRGLGYRLHLVDPLEAVADEAETTGRVVAPMPGKVVQVHVKKGQRVERGTPLAVLEAMKMEHRIVAAADGEVTDIYFDAGDLVEEGAELMTIQVGKA
jgi:3-methylcrotonyl-CoA carboxylase alpha subunit